MIHPIEIAREMERPSDFMRAQMLLNGHIARIDAALTHLRLNRASLLPSIADGMEHRLHRYRDGLIRDLDNALAAPDGAFAYIGIWNHNGRGPRVMDACEAVDKAIARAPETLAYRDMIAARRVGL